MNTQPRRKRRRGPPGPGWSTGHNARATGQLGGPASELAYEVGRLASVLAYPQLPSPSPLRRVDIQRRGCGGAERGRRIRAKRDQRQGGGDLSIKSRRP
eukprot:1026346-Pyramimonas_sp.AAC.2